MGNESRDHASYSWWWDTHNRPHQSQWLQTTLSDLDDKIKMILSLVQEDGDSFAKRAEMYYQKRPQLIKMVEDLHKSYRSLAEKYDQLRSESFSEAHSRRFSNNTKQVHHLQNSAKKNPENCIVMAPNSNPESVVQDPDLELDTLSADFEDDELTPTDTNTGKQEREKESDFGIGGLEREKMWNELMLKVSKLVEENLGQQAELIRRNEEKREIIKDLCLHVNRLKDENRALKSNLAECKVDVKQTRSKMSRMKEAFAKLLR